MDNNYIKKILNNSSNSSRVKEFDDTSFCNKSLISRSNGIVRSPGKKQSVNGGKYSSNTGLIDVKKDSSIYSIKSTTKLNKLKTESLTKNRSNSSKPIRRGTLTYLIQF